MHRFPTLEPIAGRNTRWPSIADPDARAAYHSLEEAISFNCTAAGDECAALVQSTLQSYARALSEPSAPQRRHVWEAFVQSAARLYDAVDRCRDPDAGPRRRHAVQTLRQIVLENADLIPCVPQVECS